MGDRLKQIREKSKLRRQILAQQLGASGGESIGDLLTSKDEQEVKKLKLSKEKNTISDDQVQGSKEANLPGIPAGPTKVLISEEKKERKHNVQPGDQDPEKTKEDSEEEEVEEVVYKDSSHFLKVF
ncbi:unnamed protein product, partial [Porites evermanni]